MDKQKIIDIALWAIVAYAVALLIYWTLKIFNQNAESISALGSLLSASATFFAAYVAVKLFNDWRDPANYATTKEQVLEALGVLSQVRYQLSFMLDHLYTLKRTNEFLILNEDILNYSKNDIHQKFFDIVKNIRFLKNKLLFEEFGKINHHFIHSENFYLSCIKEYQKYYNYLVDLDELKDKEIFVAPYRSYRSYGLEINNNLALYSLKRTLESEVGYSYNDLNQEQEIRYTYNNTIEMLSTTIALIDSFELELLDKIRV
ncbi:hypothetical protein ACVIAJ_07075 [Acinetobacter johnsonii]|uniref:Uncharacterized protein n=1 Tax=Acinetobacter johnsonii TaxID=40214 RepID=A0A1R7Q9B9_ACIJO|nr:hypothetical protein [Acinetobacter johnsonii]SJX20853.1 hypothetical protein ACNJC6_00451 [Acinetobacter johnsonii]